MRRVCWALTSNVVRRFQAAAERRAQNPGLPYNPRNTFDSPIPENPAEDNSSQCTASTGLVQSITQTYVDSIQSRDVTRKRAGSISTTQLTERSRRRKQQRIREMQQIIAEDKLEKELEDEMRKRGLELLAD